MAKGSVKRRGGVIQEKKRECQTDILCEVGRRFREKRRTYRLEGKREEREQHMEGWVRCEKKNVVTHKLSKEGGWK
jgi:hypothetical protein